MPIPWTFLKALSYPATAIASAGSGALVMYFAKPDVDLEKENQKWNEDMQKLKTETDNLKSQAKKIAEEWKNKAGREQKSTNQLVNFSLTTYDAKVTQYTNCLDRLFNEISSYAKSSWFSVLSYNQKQRVSRCGQRPQPYRVEV